MKRYVFRVTAFVVLSFILGSVSPGRARAGGVSALGISADNRVIDTIILTPGESRSVKFQYDAIAWDPGSYHIALIVAEPSDDQTHELTINLTPVGDVGSEMAYFTGGAFIGRGATYLLELLEPRFTYGYKDVNYTVDIHPAMSFGFIFSAAMFQYSYIDFPIDMAMTLTLSN